MKDKKDFSTWSGNAPQFGRRKGKRVQVTPTGADQKPASDPDISVRRVQIIVKRAKLKA